MKRIFTITLLFISFIGGAQTAKYNASSIANTLYAQIHKMEGKLYSDVLKGKFKAYKSDSLISYYSLEEIKNLDEVTHSVQNAWSTNGEKDSTYVTHFNSDKDGKGLCSYYKSSTNDMTNPVQSIGIRSVAVMYAPNAGNTGIVLPEQPMFFVKYEDVKASLTKEELRLLTELSNIAVSDKFYLSTYPMDSEHVKMSNEYYYSPGIFNEFTKFALLNKTTLNALSKNIYTFTVYLLHEALVDMMNKAQSKKDTSASGRKWLETMLETLATPNHIELYTNPNDPSSAKDTVIYAIRPETDFKFIAWDMKTGSVGIETESVKNDLNVKGTFALQKENFVGAVPKWLSEFLFGEVIK
jgi:hypothetical protein